MFAECRSSFHKLIETQLKYYPQMKASIENLQSDIEDIKEGYALSVAGQYETVTDKKTNKPYVRMKVRESSPSGTHSSPVENQYYKCQNDRDLQDLEITLKSTIGEVQRWERSLQTLLPNERKVIELFYFENKGWTAVASALGYSEPQCRRIRDAAINKLAVARRGVSGL